MALIHIVRLALFAVVLLFSIIILGLAANIEASFNQHFRISSTPASLALAVSIITLLTMVPILVIEFIRKGAITSVVFVELAWTGFLWVLWLANAGEAAATSPDPSFCSAEPTFLRSPCSSAVAITAFSFLNWLILMGWFFTLLVFSIIGNHWQSSVPDTELHKKNTAATGSAFTGQPNMAAAPNAQYNYPPQQPMNTGSYPNQGYPAQAYPPSPMPGHNQSPPPQTHTPGSVPV